MENYLKKMKDKEDNYLSKRKLIFKDARATKSYGLRLKALDTFKKTYED